jgi:hypothetical protein
VDGVGRPYYHWLSLSLRSSIYVQGSSIATERTGKLGGG